jgi:uroporphyrinogen-III decarboxylase
MQDSLKKIHDFYSLKPNAPIYQTEFGWYCMEKWTSEGYLKEDDIKQLFMFDDDVCFSLSGLGWCEAGFCPIFDEEIIEDRGAYEVVRDFAGRHVLYFKGRRNGFMPEYLDHPVKDFGTWEKDVKWRLSPDNDGRFNNYNTDINAAIDSAVKGFPIIQRCVGGYMYLRSLIGPENLLYMFYDNPELIHDCMKTWFELADAVTSKNQEKISFDEFFIGEDICYNHGSLISPDMIKEFLFPYYAQLIQNIKKRQIDKNKTLHFHVDTDGYCLSVIDLYRKLGMDYMSPFEVASGCDVVKVAEKYPDLLISGGIDKRILASGTDAIDRELERIMPAMRLRGGYIPTCDHGVPEEVSFKNYLHYRQRMQEYCN